MINRFSIKVTGIVLAALLYSVQAEFYPERIYRERTKTSLDFGWKFFRGDPAGDPSGPAFNDAQWLTVNVPHSASYDEPTGELETSHYKGNCWYRKHFTMPPTIHNGKYFLEFEGAMQVADVWLNGKKLGTHDNSGYTWFSFDVTGTIAGDNVLAVRLNNKYNGAIPPGCDGDKGTFPDYLLFSGLYRDVWLVTTDACHIPLYGQRISVPKATVSATSAKIRIKTPVVSASAGTVGVYTVAVDPSGNKVTTDSMSQTVAANSTTLFDMTVGPVADPKLWSPEKPNLYTVFTQIVKDGKLVDDNVERIGIRWYDWTWDGGFSLNGTPTVIKGASIHQSIAWIENAMPRSRFAEEVGLAKEMGANLLRCAHFPRDPSFYNACDELGMMVMAEVPTWGTTTSAYPDSFWVRLNNCMREMIEVGYNHPSIIAWGLFNEPHAAYNAENQIPLEAKTAHTMDSTRMIYIADNNNQLPELLNLTDIEGLNYNELDGPCKTMQKPIINTEYHQGWLDWCYRGSAKDNESATGYAMTRWNIWTNLFTIQRTNKLAGACMWSFNDYWSEFIKDKPMGVVDHFRIPKAVFYLFRKYWTNIPSETPVPGLTPAKLQLNADIDSLVCDSTDITIVTASFRDASGVCVDTKSGPSDSIPVTFTVEGPATMFGKTTVKAYAGKCAVVIKSTNTPGTITVKATSSSPDLTASPVTIISRPADMSMLPYHGAVSVSHRRFAPMAARLRLTFLKNRITVVFPARELVTDNVRIYNAQGKTVPCPVAVRGTAATIDTRTMAPGCYSIFVGGAINTTRKFILMN